ncbi:MAG TPA: PQQ-dependent sugar dehydrogenase [Actinobacteria bacterium]|nr:PQQ-dependent sugar dehydrogenase [Actinomycetota bacterium]
MVKQTVNKGLFKASLVALSLALFFSITFTGCTQPAPRNQSQKDKNSEPIKKGKGPLLPPEISNLDLPTDLEFSEDGTLFFTEKTGSLRVVKNGKLQSDPVVTFNVPSILGYHETGLLGLALHPRFSRNNLIFVYYTYRSSGKLYNRVVRFNWRRPRKQTIIVDKIIASRIHDGGKLVFGPDKKIYVSVGEAGQPQLSRRTNSPNGKILRLTDRGQIPEDNPFPGSPVFAYGLRNVFGLAFDSLGLLYATENGPEKNDEINLIEAGADYGWPIETGVGSGRFKRPLATFRESIAPTGIVFYDKKRLGSLRNKLVFGDYNGGNLYSLDPYKGGSSPKIAISFEDGITAIAVSPDGALYVATESDIKRVDKIKP